MERERTYGGKQRDVYSSSGELSTDMVRQADVRDVGVVVCLVWYNVGTNGTFQGVHEERLACDRLDAATAWCERIDTFVLLFDRIYCRKELLV